ncbi:hypothetical protein PsorP6_001878 [Peronosclerospora sorghi]|uniref:Uncharacterized protein n=1 Tax=Peronosclerospora sorghi TaxID=230839 RepID=A0ACC0WWX5_9STRA|nr:hypothetical protein PsorP6_001878 [Peronosclerospora sorghi]
MEHSLSGPTVKKLNHEGIANFKWNLDGLLDILDSETWKLSSLRTCGRTYMSSVHLLRRESQGKYVPISSDTVSSVLTEKVSFAHCLLERNGSDSVYRTTILFHSFLVTAWCSVSYVHQIEFDAWEVD